MTKKISLSKVGEAYFFFAEMSRTILGQFFHRRQTKKCSHSSCGLVTEMCTFAGGVKSIVDIFALIDSHHVNQQLIVSNFGNKAIFPNAITPIFF